MDSQSIKYHEKRGKVSTVALDDIRVSFENVSLVNYLQNANDELDPLLDESIDDVFDDYNSTSYLPHKDNEY